GVPAGVTCTQDYDPAGFTHTQSGSVCTFTASSTVKVAAGKTYTINYSTDSGTSFTAKNVVVSSRSCSGSGSGSSSRSTTSSSSSTTSSSSGSSSGGSACDPNAWVYMGSDPNACVGHLGESCGWTTTNQSQGYHCQTVSWGTGCEPGGTTCPGGSSSSGSS